jgi:hypothetical protein
MGVTLRLRFLLALGGQLNVNAAVLVWNLVGTAITRTRYPQGVSVVFRDTPERFVVE